MDGSPAHHRVASKITHSHENGKAHIHGSHQFTTHTKYVIQSSLAGSLMGPVAQDQSFQVHTVLLNMDPGPRSEVAMASAVTFARVPGLLCPGGL